MFAAVRFVRDHCPPEVDATARHVAITLASFSTTAGVTTIGARRLADVTGLHSATIARAIRRLEEAGVLAVSRPGAGQRSSYRFPVVTPAEVVPNRPHRARTSVIPNRALSGSEARAEGARVVSVNRLENARDAARPTGSIFLPGTGWVSPQKAASA